jgi:hypothetical protein
MCFLKFDNLIIWKLLLFSPLVTFVTGYRSSVSGSELVFTLKLLYNFGSSADRNCPILSAQWEDLSKQRFSRDARSFSTLWYDKNINTDDSIQNAWKVFRVYESVMP